VSKGSQQFGPRIQWLGLTAAAWLCACPPVLAAPKPQPTWEKIETTVTEYFAAIPGYRSSDIISRNQVQSLLTRLAKLGWNVPDSEKLLAKIPADNSWLVVNLRTPAGTKFMRQIARLPGGYDCTDRLANISGGRKTVAALIRGPGGAQMIEYLTTSRFGKNMAQELTLVPGGADFKKPTGMLYTSADLLTELAQQYTNPKR